MTSVADMISAAETSSAHPDWRVIVRAGVQVGVLGNATEKGRGLQWGFLNVANSLRGVQIGILNFNADRGVQIGILNVNPESFLPFFPLINFNF